MKKIKIGFLPFILPLLAIVVASCTYSSYPPRPYYGGVYHYGNRYVRPPRVVVVRPAPRVVYRNPRYQAPNNGRPGYDARNNNPRSYGTRSNRNYRNYSSRGRSSRPR
jgi:hypothetical protein